jgi:hypothetical protein
MAQADNALRISELDFESIRTNLKNFLKNQSEFTDYDFDGSGMSVLLDILAYNTHYMGYYLNMVGNEAFLDTAQIRQSVISHAKHTNYVPNSKTAATAIVDIIITPESPEDTSASTLTLPKYTRFVSEPVGGINYVFTTVNAVNVTKADGKFTFSSVNLKQGEPITQNYIANGGRRFIIPSANVDIDTIVVTVQQASGNSDTKVWTLATDLTEITANSTIFYVEENADANGNYTLQFGDGTIGKALSNDNILIVNYLETAGEFANKVNNFVSIESIGTPPTDYTSNIVVRSVSAAAGGAAKETVEEIKYRAPIHYTAQNRAVTKSDYEILLAKDYPNIDAISVWGGDEEDSPVYGKIFISLKPKENYEITLDEKERIKNEIVRNRSVLTIIPEIVDPDFTYLTVTADVNYNPNITSLDEAQLKELVRQSVLDYKNANLKDFNSTFRLSQLEKAIDGAHGSILGSSVTFYAQKRIELRINSPTNYVTNFNIPLYRGFLDDKFFTFPAININDLEGNQKEAFIEDTPGALTGVDSISVITAGQNYTFEPTVTITGDGTGATAIANIINGKVSNITITNRGSDYTVANATITGGNGSGATCKVNLQARNGILRSFYYKPNGEKIVLNPNLGTIDYTTGLISIALLNPNSLVNNDRYDSITLTLNAVPNEGIIRPQRNRILDIDETDSRSIIINMIPEV